jgi:hypothetical protein
MRPASSPESISFTYSLLKGSLTAGGPLSYHHGVLNKEVSMRRIFALLILAITTHSWAWGPQGHMVVAQIAENNLTPTARAAVKRILDNKSLASVATWADAIKSKGEWAHTKSWHFADIPDGEDYSTSEHNHDGDVIGAITEMVGVLNQRNADPVSKENALKFVVHFVGDIHQPLHVGRPEDRGGNDIRISFNGKNSNLHALWDSLMIGKSQMDYEAYASWLESGKVFYPPYDLPAFSFSTIITEDMEARSAIYHFGAAEGPIRVTDAYYKRNVDLMNRQLLTGGKRLATLLNSIFK